MITIAANTIFRPFCSEFALQSTETTTVSLSVDGVTFTALEDTFTGTQVFKDHPSDVFVKCDKQVFCTVPCEIIKTHTVTINATNCRVEGSVSSYANGEIVVADGQTIVLHAIPFNGYKFVGWSDGDENPTKVINVTDDVTVAITCEATGANGIPTGWTRHDE